MNQQVNEYFAALTDWVPELNLLREIVLSTELTEEYKWRGACYTFKGANVLMLAPFKAHCTISFFKGVLLADTKNILVKPGDSSQSVKFLKFTSIDEIKENIEVIKQYIYEAIEVEKAGLKVDFKRDEELEYPAELVSIFEGNAAFEEAFEKLTRGKKRGYLLHYNSAKQTKTKVSRIEKSIDRIIEGYGFHDCVCGLSKRMPRCDGSHKQLA